MIHLLILFQILGLWANNANYLVLSGTNTVFSRGVDAILYNPANLSLDKGFSMRVISPSFAVFNSSFSLSNYNYYSSGVFLEEADKKRIMNSIPNTGLALLVNTNITGFEFSSGGFAFSARALGFGKVTIPKIFFDLMLWGNELDKVYQFEKMDEAAVAFLSFTSSYGRMLGINGRNLSLGGGVRYIYGLYTAYISEANLHLLTSKYALDGDGFLKYRTGQGGGGFAFDFGLSTEISDVARVGFSLLNVNTGINWLSNTHEGWLSIRIDSLNLSNMEDVITSSDSSYTRGPFKTSLPAYLMIAFEYDKGNLQCGVGYEQVINETPISSRRPQLSLAVKYNFGTWFVPMAGMAIGGEEGFLVGIGFCFAIKKVGLNFGIQNVGTPFYGIRGLKLGVDIGYKIL